VGSDEETTTLRISGQIDESDLAAIETEVRRYRPRLVVFDLAEATHADRAVVRFLAARKAEGVELLNCPRYIRRWISRELFRLERLGPPRELFPNRPATPA